MPASQQLFWIYVAAALAISVVLAALAAALFIYQRHSLKLHRVYAKKLLDAHEEERAWVAREVHDDALQRVAILQHELSEWDTRDKVGMERDAVRIEALRSELQDLGVMLRRVAHRLHPAIIDQAGLLPALEQLASDVSRASGIEVETDFSEDGRASQLSRERALMLYRIAQEGLRNVAKHSRAKRARIIARSQAGRNRRLDPGLRPGLRGDRPETQQGVGVDLDGGAHAPRRGAL